MASLPTEWKAELNFGALNVVEDGCFADSVMGS